MKAQNISKFRNLKKNFRNFELAGIPCYKIYLLILKKEENEKFSSIVLLKAIKEIRN